MSNIIVYQRKKATPEKQEKNGVYYVNNLAYAKEVLQEKRIRFIVIDLEGAEDEGIDFALFVRGMAEYSLLPIIFLASNRRWEQAAFHEIHCYDFFVKPLKKEDVITILYLYVMRDSLDAGERTVSFRVHGIVTKIDVEDIVFMRSAQRCISIHQKDKVTHIPYMRLKDCLWEQYGMLQCHRSVIVNEKYVENVDFTNHYIQLKGNLGQIDIGRKYEQEIRRRFDAERENGYTRY